MGTLVFPLGGDKLPDPWLLRHSAQHCTGKAVRKQWKSFGDSVPRAAGQLPPVGENKHFIETDIVQKRNTKMWGLWWVSFFSCRLFFFCCSWSQQRITIAVIFIIIWQVQQTLATYHTKCQVSILSSTSAQTRLTTPRNTPKQQVRQHASIENRCSL